MADSQNVQSAKGHYDAGVALFHDRKYVQSLVELNKAEDAFRKIDARGHPFVSPLPNGISGLANTLMLAGLCHQKLGDHRNAAICLETCLINAKFEKRQPLRSFLHTRDEHLADCYGHILDESGGDVLSRVMASDPDIDTALLFPFSIVQEYAVPVARLFELAPDRYAHAGEFYRRAKMKDAELRRRDKKSDEPTMKKMSVYIWGVLIAIWAVYGVIALRAVQQHYK